jgi:hypothetical protein
MPERVVVNPCTFGICSRARLPGAQLVQEGALWRVHSNSYRATRFNPSNRSDARFSPIGRPDGTTIPVLYPVTAYPRTREWAAWFHTSTPAKGLLGTSRQDDAARAVALFGDRLPESAFKIGVDREPPCQDEHLDVLLELAEHIGIERLFWFVEHRGNLG